MQENPVKPVRQVGPGLAGIHIALYARVSSERQDVDLSISAQLRALREYAEKNNYQVVKEYVDEAESGRTADRPKFQQMIADARRTRAFETILVWKFSRFARSREDAIVFKSLLKKHGVRVVSITEPSEDSPTGKLMEAIIESLDEFYSANLAQEVLRGMREAASRGYFMASQAPYGYLRIKVLDGKKERPTLKPDLVTAPVVARIFDLALRGAGLKSIAHTLNEDGIAGARNKPWTKTSIYRMLTNEAYTGTLVWGCTSQGSHIPQPVRVEGAWKALVDYDTFRRAHQLLQERSFPNSHPRRTASSYLLSGLLRCGSCGQSFGGQAAKSGQFAYYVCGTLLKRGTGTCDAPYFNASRLEEMVVGKIKERILTEENLRELVRIVNEEMDSAGHDYRQRLKVVEGELADAQRRLDKLYDALETGKLAMNDLFPRIQHLRHRQDQLQAARMEIEGLLDQRREKLTDLSEVVRYVDDMRALLTESSLVERKAFIKSFVKEIVATGHEAVLRYTLPLPPDTLVGTGGGRGIYEQDEVLAIVSNGTPGETRTPASGFGGQRSIH